MYACVSSGDVFLSPQAMCMTRCKTVTRSAGQNRGHLCRLQQSNFQVPWQAGCPICWPLRKAAADPAVKAVFYTSAAGYARRQTLSSARLRKSAKPFDGSTPMRRFFDGQLLCEFVEETEPTQHGADLIAGSLIKNPEARLAPSGGYVAGAGGFGGTSRLPADCAGHRRRNAAPAWVNRSLYQALFSGGLTCGESAVKTAAFARRCWTRLAASLSPGWA